MTVAAPITLLVVGAATSTAVLLLLPRPVRPPVPAVVPVSDGPGLLRWRVPLSGSCGVGAFLFFGGALGIVAGALTAVYAWRVLGRAAEAADARRAAGLRRDLPGAVDLLVAGLRAGLAPGPALALVGESLPGPVQAEFLAVSRRLDLGADPEVVWRELSAHVELGPLGRALGRAHARGAAVVPAGERLANELRERLEAEVEARARSVSTRAAAPLGACFLPAFVLLGIVPLVAGLLGSLHLFG